VAQAETAVNDSVVWGRVDCVRAQDDPVAGNMLEQAKAICANRAQAPGLVTAAGMPSGGRTLGDALATKLSPRSKRLLRKKPGDRLRSSQNLVRRRGNRESRRLIYTPDRQRCARRDIFHGSTIRCYLSRVPDCSMIIFFQED
jgi:hypothetical protein